MKIHLHLGDIVEVKKQTWFTSLNESVETSNMTADEYLHEATFRRSGLVLKPWFRSLKEGEMMVVVDMASFEYATGTPGCCTKFLHPIYGFLITLDTYLLFANDEIEILHPQQPDSSK